MAKIAVAGATGRVGHHIVDVLRERGHEVVPISRSVGVDVITGAGLADALTGIDSIIDAATGPSPEQEAATTFFTTAARNLQDASEKAGVQRIVVISIIGTDRYTGGYGAAKIAHEDAMRAGPIPVHVLRAAQFHEFVEQLLSWGTRDDVGYVPQIRTQVVAARTVAEAAADLAINGGPAMSEVAGPREESLVELARQLAAKSGHPARVEAATNPDDPDDELNRNGGLLPGPDAILAGPTFTEWLGSDSAE
jgi:uncharacterized protein YbjT (DUF2867 family)